MDSGLKRGTAINFGRNDGKGKACQRSITPVALDKGQSHYSVWEMTTTRRHVLVWRQYTGEREGGGEAAGKHFQQTGNDMSRSEIKCFPTARHPLHHDKTTPSQSLRPLPVTVRQVLRCASTPLEVTQHSHCSVRSFFPS